MTVCGGDRETVRASAPGVCGRRAIAASSIMNLLSAEADQRGSGFLQTRFELKRQPVFGDSGLRVALCFGDLCETEVHTGRTISHLEQLLELRFRGIVAACAHGEA